MKQNYTTIDRFQLDRYHYLKLAELNDQAEPHFTVAKYRQTGSMAQLNLINTLLECWHFIGPMAELESSHFFCSWIPGLEEDFPSKPLTGYKSYKPERHYRLEAEEVAANGV